MKGWISMHIEYSVWLSRNIQLDALMKLLTTLDSRLRGNDMFFQSVSSLPVIPAKAGMTGNLSILDKRKNILIS